MKHMKQGEIRAYFDSELSAGEHDRVEKHLAHCPVCEKKANRVKSRGVYASSKLQALHTHAPLKTAAAQQRLAGYLSKTRTHTPEKHRITMNHRYRPVWVAIMVTLVLGFIMTFAPVRALANDFLALFRIQKIAFVEFNPLNLPNREDTLRTAAMEIERMAKEEIDITMHGEPQIVEQAAVQALMPYPVRFPDIKDSASRITLQPGFDMTLQLNLTEIRTLLDALGYGGIDLPDNLDGAEVQAAFDKSVITAFGSCTENDPGADCTVFIQTQSPNVTAPPELDLQQIGQLYLQLLGMKPAQAARFSRNVDWTTTLVVPIPSTDATYKDVQIDGVKGTVVEGLQHNEVVLMWVKNNIVYALIGTGDVETFLAIAGTLE